MTQRESTETTRLLQWLNGLDGVFAYKVHADMYQMNGVSDVQVCWLGRFLVIEMKREGGTASPKQLHFQRKVRECGHGAAFVAEGFAQARRWLIERRWLDPIEHTGRMTDEPREPPR